MDFYDRLFEKILVQNTVKPVYKDHSREPENVAFIQNTVKPVYKDHSREPENVAFIQNSQTCI